MVKLPRTPWNTAWAKLCFPFQRCWMIYENFLGADQKSFSIAFPNSFHTWVFASATAEAADPQAPWYLSAASGDPWDNQARKASFFSLMASFTTDVHQRVLRLRQALMTF